MTRPERITRRLRGLGFEPDGDRRWVRGDCPPDRTWRDHRLYGWQIGVLTVEYEGDGRFTLITMLGGQRRANVEKVVLGKGLTLSETITAISENLLQQRTSGRLPGWWHLPKGKTT